MEQSQEQALDPAGLPVGTRVGPWRLVGFQGQGTYGAVYRAVREGQAEVGPVALKLAVYAEDPRFEREAELLQRIRHPSVPRLLDHGQWTEPTGVTYPFVAMEWVEGTPLYDWARERHVSSRQVLRVLAQMASALEATVAAAAVHRDVKGENVLVRRGDERAFLMDFGAGNYQGARTLTTPPRLQGTPAYRSPQALLSMFSFRHTREPYVAGPADDLFALGITAWRLVTGEFPPPMEPREDETGAWHLSGVVPLPPIQVNPRVDPQLNALILRMLSVAPEARGTASELVEALEQAVERATPEADQPLFTLRTQLPPTRGSEDAAIAAVLSHRLRPELLGNAARLRALRRRRRARNEVARGRSAHPHDAPSDRAGPQEHASSWRPLLVLAALLSAPLLCGRWSVHPPVVEMPALAEAAPDAGTALGETSLIAPRSTIDAPSSWKVIVEEVPQKPFPGQLKPDANGRCPLKGHVVINGACWVPLALEREACEEMGYVQKGQCYSPAYPPRRQPASTPPDPQ